MGKIGGDRAMPKRLVMMSFCVAAAFTVRPAPAQAEFFSYEQMRLFCLGGSAEGAEFRTVAGHRRLAETYRARCRMYLLGKADAYLERGAARNCLPAGTSDSDVAQVLAEGLVSRRDPPAGGVGELV